MYTFKCVDCDVSVEKQVNRPCKDGKHRCKSCGHNLNCKKYDYSIKGREKNIQRRIKNSGSAKARAKRWAEEHPERRKELERNYRRSEKGRDGSRRRSLEYYWRDPEYGRRKAVARAHGVTPAFILELRERQPNCQLCGTEENLTVDHMIPVSHGGKATRTNIQSLCGPCNSFKGDKVFLANNSGYLVESA